MAKRKAAVNDIIYELDNDDSEISSDDEVKLPKIGRIKEINSPNTTQSDSFIESSCIEVVDIDSSSEKLNEIHSPKVIRIGGKSPTDFIIIDEVSDTASPKTPVTGTERRKKLSPDTIFNEDIIIDSPASNSDPGVVGCENRTPLVTVRFRDSKLAMTYKDKIKGFLMNLIKLHTINTESDSETDLELDIWPEDLVEDDLEEVEKPADNLFFVDTDPGIEMLDDIPSYSQNASMISNIPDEEPLTVGLRRRGPTCFNCNGSHTMRECTMPRNSARIAENRKAMMKLGRYHVEDEQKYGHLVPGRISGLLRHALGLKRQELPMHIYRMRQLGYPPGWLEEARISHSGITLFDSSGQATLDPEEEEGEVSEPGSKDKYDIKKILDFPGFNVPASSRYKEAGHKIGVPPMSEHDSKMAMLQILAPNATKAYKRKKLTFFPSAPGQAQQEGTAEMDIDSGDEVADFPSQPPLPDDAPVLPPPPPDSPPPLPNLPPPLPNLPPPLPNSLPLPDTHSEKTEPPKVKIEAAQSSKDISKDKAKSENKTDSDDDVEVVEVMEVVDIPVPKEDLITIDLDGDVSEIESGRVSPSLDALEEKKRLLLNALDADVTILDDTLECNENDNKDEEINETKEQENKDKEDVEVKEPDMKENEENAEKIDNKENKETNKDDTKDGINDKVDVVNVDSTADVNKENQKDAPSEMEVVVDKVEGSIGKPEEESSTNDTTAGTEVKTTEVEPIKTPASKMGLVRSTEHGTPVINTASPYLKLPSDDKFAKDICDIINFENLPNSTGKYKQISTLLKKVKSEVDRIQES